MGKLFCEQFRVLLAIAVLLPTPAAMGSGPVIDSDPVSKAQVSNERGFFRVPKQVTLIIEPQRLLASNVRLSRLDEITLSDGEQYLRHAESDVAIVVVTNRRLLAYGPVVGWRSLPLGAAEQLESVTAEDYAVFITTSKRYINFSADTGVWAQKPRQDR